MNETKEAMIRMTQDEMNSARYALLELANRRAEQAIDRKEPLYATVAEELRALANRISNEWHKQ